MARGGALEERNAWLSGIGKDGNSLEWEPVFAEAGSSGDFGYTHGTYRRQRIDADGNPILETGKYVSIWRRDESGRFRVVLYTGTPDPPMEETPPGEWASVWAPCRRTSGYSVGPWRALA